jgi:hypothetical protein
VFLKPTAAERWIYAANYRRDAKVKDARCLMPKLAKSSPAAWWAHAEHLPGGTNSNLIARWFGVGASDGAAIATSPEQAQGCGFPIANDGGQIVVSSNTSERVKKVAQSGGTEWQISSQLSPTNYYGPETVQSTAASGETNYAIGNLVGRAGPTGTLAFEVLTGRTNPKLVTTDAAGNTLIVYADNTPAVVKISNTGNVLWTTNIDVPSCQDELVATRKLANDDILVATQTCGEGRVFRINANGAIAWQRVVSGNFALPYVRVRALAEDALGNIIAGGCISPNQNAEDPRARSLLTSWSGTGVERWSQSADMIGNTSDCVTSVVADSSGNSNAVVSSGEGGAPLLWSLNSSGIERWRHSNLLVNPVANEAEAALDESGNLIVLGQSRRNELQGQTVSLRKISLASVASTLRVKFLDVPTTPVGYRVPFSVRIGLRSGSDQPVVASANQAVRIALESGSGVLNGTLECSIAIGNSECVAAGLLYDQIESGVLLSAWADGMPSATSNAISFSAAPTSTALAIQPNSAMTAYDVRALVTDVSSPAVPPFLQSGYLSGPTSNDYNAFRNCSNDYTPLAGGVILRSRCEILLRNRAFPISANYVASSANLTDSQQTLSSPVIAKAQSKLVVTEDPSNTGVGGDRVRFRVALSTASDFNVVRYVPYTQVTMSSGSCILTQASYTGTFNAPNSYYLCEVTNLASGSHSITFNFAGDDDLLPAQSVTRSVSLVNGAVVRGEGPTGSICSTLPEVTCTTTQNSTVEWQCKGPEGMSGSLFFYSQSAHQWFPGTPIAFANVRGVLNMGTRFASANALPSCNMDVDGDGASLAATDGTIILRRMLGVSGDALIVGATHRCVPFTAVGVSNRINLSGYDLDGNGQVDPSTDGVMLLRVMLGIRGDSVTVGAVGNAATRTTWNQIRDYLSSYCGLYIYD